MLSSQSLLWVNAGLAILVVLLFVTALMSRNRLRPPSRLRLRSSPRALDAGGGMSPEQRQFSSEDSLGIKNLNVIFVYNGHSFDAHEVLGVPAGASRDAVRAAYLHSLKSTGPDTHAFLEAAYRAINS